jgi:hypothetical protein
MQQLLARAEIVIGDGSGSWLVRREQREQRAFVHAIDGRDADEFDALVRRMNAFALHAKAT